MTSSEELKYIYINNKCKEDIYNKNCNQFLLSMEEKERNELAKKSYPFLYPNLNDINFNIKIAEKKEFYDTAYDGTLYKDFKNYANILSNADFELSNHQLFVKNFLSFNTPYNSLLLYHGLGSGKTCSAIIFVSPAPMAKGLNSVMKR